MKKHLKAFFTGLTTLSSVYPLSGVLPNAIQLSAAPLNITLFKCVSMTNQECEVSLQIVNVNGDKPVFHPFSMQKCVFLMLLKI